MDMYYWQEIHLCCRSFELWGLFITTACQVGGSSNPSPSGFPGGEGISSILQEENNRVEMLPALPYSSSLLPRGGDAPYLIGDGGEGAGIGSPLLPGSLQDTSVCRLVIFCM